MKSIKTALKNLKYSILAGALLTPLAFAGDQQAMTPPGKYFDLSSFKLQIPTVKRDSVEEVVQPALHDYASPYFYRDDTSGAMVFYCPDNGATTRGSHFPRTELRSAKEWSFVGQHALRASLAVAVQPGTGGIIVGQIHGNGQGTEALKIRWANGDIVVGVKVTPGSTEERYTLAHGLALGERFSYVIEQNDHAVTVTVNGLTKSFTYDKSWDTETVYFKAGNYLQDNSASGSSGVVKFFSLSEVDDEI